MLAKRLREITMSFDGVCVMFSKEMHLFLPQSASDPFVTVQL